MHSLPLPPHFMQTEIITKKANFYSGEGEKNHRCFRHLGITKKAKIKARWPPVSYESFCVQMGVLHVGEKTTLALIKRLHTHTLSEHVIKQHPISAGQQFRLSCLHGEKWFMSVSLSNMSAYTVEKPSFKGVSRFFWGGGQWGAERSSMLFVVGLKCHQVYYWFGCFIIVICFIYLLQIIHPFSDPLLQHFKGTCGGRE